MVTSGLNRLWIEMDNHIQMWFISFSPLLWRVQSLSNPPNPAPKTFSVEDQNLTGKLGEEKLKSNKIEER